MWYARVRGRIVNNRVALLLQDIIGHLGANVGVRVHEAGLLRTEELAIAYSRKGIFTWCPKARDWLKEEGYVSYIGVQLGISVTRWSEFAENVF